MSDQHTLISKAFQTFMTKAPAHAQAWGEAIQGLGKASALDPKTSLVVEDLLTEAMADGIAIVLVSHDPEQRQRLAHQIIGL